MTDPANFTHLAPRVRFVLVTPSLPANIGAAARALRTMGFVQLVVVAPQEPAFKDDAQARALATHGIDLLANALVQPTLAAALAGDLVLLPALLASPLGRLFRPASRSRP